MSLLPSTAYQPPQVRPAPNNVFYSQQQSRTRQRLPPPRRVIIPEQPMSESDIEDDFPTPRGDASGRIVSPPQSAIQDDDDLYGVSDADSEVVPFRISNSVKRMITRDRLPSLVIPPVKSTSRAKKTVSPLARPVSTPISPGMLAKLQAATLQVPMKISAPSLDGSLTSEEHASMCPSTPSMRAPDDNDDAWDMPLLLHPQAMDTLHQLTIELGPVTIDTVVEASEEQIHEMQERGLDMQRIAQPSSNELEVAHEPISAISIPSPGGFFASLAPTAQQVWTSPQRAVQGPSTSTAESFYDLPWGPRSSSITERVVTIESTGTDGPPTARRAMMSPRNLQDIQEQQRQHEYDESYDKKLYEEASSKLNRTSLWLSQQENYLSVLGESNPPPAAQPSPNPPKTPVVAEVESPFSSPSSSKKSVKFAAGSPSQQTQSNISSPTGSSADPLFYNAFQHLFDPLRSSREAFKHRKYRADALQMQRLYVPEVHRAQLQGLYSPKEPAKDKDDFSHLPSAPDDPNLQKHRDAVAAANREREALQQISMSVWNLEALRHLSGDSLLPRPAKLALRVADKDGIKPKILDLGGNPTADWAWAVALTHREATICTAVHSSMYGGAQQPWKAHRGPSNHRVVSINNTWSLPFPSNSFDVVSARTLHMLLRTTAAPDHATDEYDATLAEIKRVLKPGGVFCFELLDATVHDLATSPLTARSPAGPATRTALEARSAEFASTLCSRAYDPCPTATFLTRVVDAGFARTERAWVSLPLDSQRAASAAGCEPDAGVEALTSLVGSLAWEKWMLKVQREVGRPEERLLDGIAKALGGAGADAAAMAGPGAGWCMLTGCTRKIVRGKTM